MGAPLDGWIETARGTVHAWQCDHMGHVNVRAYGEFFEEACWQLYAHVGITPTVLRAGEILMAAVQQNIAYKAELLAGDTIVVRTRVLEARIRGLLDAMYSNRDAQGYAQPWQRESIASYITVMHNARPFMPPFPGSEREVQALAAWLASLQTRRDVIEGAQVTGVTAPPRGTSL